MPKKNNKKSVRSKNQTAGLQAVKESGVKMIRSVDNVDGVGAIKAARGEALDDFFLPEYGGSE